MRHIYYKNDFSVEITLLDTDGEAVAVPSWQWSVEFTDGWKRYTCSLDAGNARVVDGKIICYLDGHGFRCGEVQCRFIQALPDGNYPDGYQNIMTPRSLGVVLWNKESDTVGKVECSIVPPYVIYDAYEIAKANGYTGTAEEFYRSLTSVGDLDKELDGKVDKEEGKGLSSNDFTDEDKAKLDSMGFSVRYEDETLIFGNNQ